MEFHSEPAATELVPIAPAQAAALLRSGLAIEAELLGEAFPGLVAAVSEELGGRWDFDRFAPHLQNLLMRRGDDLRASFGLRLKETQDQAYVQLTAAPAGGFGNTVIPDLDAETLSLVDEVAVDANAVIEKSANKIAGALDLPMSDLNLVIGHVAGRRGLKSSDNPLGPGVVVKALLTAAADQDLDQQLVPLLLASFEPALAKAMVPVLSALLEHYARHGVGARAIRRAMAAARPASARSENGPDTVNGLERNSRPGEGGFRNSGFGDSRFRDSQFRDSQFRDSPFRDSQPGGFRPSQFGGTPPVRAPRGADAGSLPAAEALNHIVARLESSARGTRMPPLPPAGPPAQNLMTSVDELQRLNLEAEGGGKLAMAAAGTISTWRDQLVVNTDRTVDKLTIEIVGMLFDHVMADKQVPAEIKARLSRLQFPILKAALLDAAFFASNAHPARKLLDRIAGTAVGWEPYGDDNQRYLREVDRVVHEVLEKFETDVSVFERLYAEFDKFVSEVNPAENDPVARAKKALEAAEKQEILTINTTIQVRRAFERVDLEPFIRDFLLGPWVRVMVAASIRADAQPGYAKSFRDVINDLVWSVQPKASADDRARLVKTIPGMLRVVRDGMVLINYPDRDREVFFAQLMQSHAMAVKPVDQAAYIKANLAHSEMRAKIEGMQMSGVFPVTNVPGGIRVPTQAIAQAAERFEAKIELVPDYTQIRSLDPVEEARVVEEISRWQRGHWFKIWNGTEFVRARLRWMSPMRTLFLFASGQESKPHALSAEQVRSYLTRGYLEALEQVPLTRRAVDAVVSGFEREPESAAELTRRYAQAA